MDDVPALVTQARTGAPQAYGALIRRFRNMAFGYAYAILHEPQLAEDAAQETFVEAYRCLPQLEIPQAFPVWLKRIVLKHCDRLTRGKRPTLLPLDAADGEEVTPLGGGQAAAEAAPVGPEVWSERNALRVRILEALTVLSEEQRTITTLAYIDGHAHKEIAAFLDVSASTVRSRLHSSRKLLRDRMMAIELIANGRAILAEAPEADDGVWHQLAETLLFYFPGS